MQCFARWNDDQESGICFRDQTILQFGDSWELLASFVLLNPGSALPKDEKPQNEFLASKGLPFLVNGVYYKFSIDRLMRDLLGLYSSKYPGGVLKLYNLFNLKNQDVGRALAQFKEHRNHPDMFSHEEDIRFGSDPVVIASGGNAFADAALTNELKKYIALANPNQLYSLSRAGATSFAITKAKPDNNGIVEGNYHPSYTFHYGNSTTFT